MLVAAALSNGGFAWCARSKHIWTGEEYLEVPWSSFVLFCATCKRLVPWSSFVQHVWGGRVDQRCPHHLACGAPCAPSGAARLMKVASCAHLLPCPALHTQYLSVHLSHHLHTPHHSSKLDVWSGALLTERRPQATLFTVQTIWEQQARRVQCKQQFCWPDYPASPFSRLQIEIAQLTYRYKYIPTQT